MALAGGDTDRARPWPGRSAKVGADPRSAATHVEVIKAWSACRTRRRGPARLRTRARPRHRGRAGAVAAAGPARAGHDRAARPRGHRPAGAALREAVELGASTTAVLELQLAAAGESRFRLAEADGHARAALAVSERLGLAQVRAKALYFLAENRALRGDREEMEHYLTLTAQAAPGDRELEAFAWGGARAMRALMRSQDLVITATAASRRARRPPAHCTARRARVLPRDLADPGGRRGSPGAGRGRRRPAGLPTVVPAHHGDAGLRRGHPGRAPRRAGPGRRPGPGGRGGAGRVPRLGRPRPAARRGIGPEVPVGTARSGRLRAALDSFTSLGYAALAGYAAASFSKRPRPTRWTRYGFTARETEVSALVGQGLASQADRHPVALFGAHRGETRREPAAQGSGPLTYRAGRPGRRAGRAFQVTLGG